MKYLDERIKVTVSDFSWVGEHAAGMYQYYIFDNADPATNLFVGNLYLSKNQYTVTVDITDIARNYCASTNKIVMLEVGIQFSKGEPSGISEPIVPIYRYPNEKADDNKYNFDSYDTFLVSGKQSVKNFNYSNSLLPTYPQRVTDKIKIDYLLGLKSGTGTDSFTFDYGPTQTISNTLTGNPTLYNISYPLAYGSQTDVNPLFDITNYGVIESDPTISFPLLDGATYLNYNYITTVPPSEVNWQFANGEENYTNPTTYPFSLTISDSEYNDEDYGYVCDFFVIDANYNDIINTYPSIGVGNYSCKVVCGISETFETHDCSGIDWYDWDYTNNYYTTTAYNNMTVGTTLISVRFTDGSGSYVVELDETLPSDGVSFEWDQTLTSDIQSAKIYFHGTTNYDTDIPLELVNNQSGDAEDYKNLVFTITKDDKGRPVVYVNHSVYTININYNATLNKANSVSLADDIVAYRSNRYGYRYQTDNNCKFKKLWGDIEVGDTELRTEYQADADYLEGFLVRLYNANDVCIYTFPFNLQKTTQNLWIPSGLIKGTYIQIEYFSNQSYYSGAFYIEPTNPLSNYYYYTYLNFNLDSNGILTIKPYASSYKMFAYYQDNSTKIGQFGCPSGYYLIWKDRLGSQQIQPFQKVDTYSEDITGSEITNYYGKRSLYKVEVQPKWKVQTGWISDEAYRCYESLFVSPTLQLYDADSDILYDVILKSRSYTEKTFLNQGKQFNLQLELEQTEKQNILF